MPQNPWAVIGIGLLIGGTGAWLFKRHRQWLEVAAILPLIPP
jgi:LPXTG-motif cell wall-anchored protein